jgi:DHA2 family multidrug resistance protein
MSSWEVMLSKGQEWNWYNDPTWRVQRLFFIFVIALGALVFRELRIAHPVADIRPLAERNFAGSCVIIFCAFGMLYGASTSVPGLLQSLTLLIWPRIVLICGLSLIFAPISVAAFKYTPTHLRAAAVGLSALLRNGVGSVGTSMAQTIVERREQLHNATIGELIDPFNPVVLNFSEQGRMFFLQQSGDSAAAELLNVQA